MKCTYYMLSMIIFLNLEKKYKMLLLKSNPGTFLFLLKSNYNHAVPYCEIYIYIYINFRCSPFYLCPFQPIALVRVDLLVNAPFQMPGGSPTQFGSFVFILPSRYPLSYQGNRNPFRSQSRC